MKFILVVLIIQISIFSSHAEEITSEKKAYNKVLEAMTLMDEGKIDDAIILLNEAIKLDSSNYMYSYELGLAYYMQKEYHKAISLFENVTKFDSINDQCYQMLGNSYDLNGDSAKAVETYKKGLEKFPKSGRLYLELGNMHQGNWMNAIEFYEKGIEAEPSFSSNYYWASLFFCSTEEELWGILYGEIFMNLERGSKRTETVSKLLFDTYKKGIKFNTDTTIEVSFSQNIIIPTSKESSNKKNIPYGLLVYEPTISLSVIGSHEITLESLNKIRGNFIANYKLLEHNVNYPNIIFTWHEKLIENGFFHCYNYWLLMKGSPDEFNSWYSKNNEKFQEFIKWFTDNTMIVDSKNYFHRYNYQ